MYTLDYSRQSVKDAENLKQAGLLNKAETLLDIIRNNPYQNPPPYEKLQGAKNTYSRRITLQHRLVYMVHDETVTILRMWTHYE